MLAQMLVDRQVTVGVDTHADQHVGVALDQLGRLLGTHAVPSTAAGHAALLAWARRFGTVDRVGIEGTGSYGAGLSRWLRAHGVAVVEVERPKRPAHRGAASPIRSTPRRPRGRCWPGPARSSASGRCTPPAARR